MAPKRSSGRGRPDARTLGWREWAQLPQLGVQAIKAKLDTGARTSALHAFGLKPFERDGIAMVRFTIHPLQRSSGSAVSVEAALADERRVRSSDGRAELRPVIETDLQLGGERWPIELTLTSRDEMGFRMLLGRQALKGRVVVDSGRSFVAGSRPKEPA